MSAKWQQDVIHTQTRAAFALRRSKLYRLTLPEQLRPPLKMHTPIPGTIQWRCH